MKPDVIASVVVAVSSLGAFFFLSKMISKAFKAEREFNEKLIKKLDGARVPSPNIQEEK
jgi:hypothetical protein